MTDFLAKRTNTTVGELGVAIVNLASGEDVIGTVQQMDGGVIIIDKPLTPRVAVNEKGMQIGMTPIRPYAQADEMVLHAQRINWILPATPEMEAAYRQATSSVQLVGADALNALPLPNNGRIKL